MLARGEVISLSYWNVKSREVINTIIAEVGVEDEDALRKAILDAYPFGERRHHPYKVFLEEVKKTMTGIRLQKTRLRPAPVQMGLL